MADELAALKNAGVIVVASAGNDYAGVLGISVMYPALDVSTIAVSAVYDSDSLPNGPANEWFGGR